MNFIGNCLESRSSSVARKLRAPDVSMLSAKPSNLAAVVAVTAAALTVVVGCTENPAAPQDGLGAPVFATTQFAEPVVAGATVAQGPPTVVGAVTITWEAAGTVNVHTPPSVINIGTDGTLEINTDGTVSVTPPSNVVTADTHTFEYEFDNGGGPVTRTGTVETTIGSVPTVPEYPVLTMLSYVPGSGSDRTVFTPGAMLDIHPNGSIEGDASGGPTIMPPDDFHDGGTFQYTLSDWSGLVTGDVVVRSTKPLPVADEYTGTGNIVIHDAAPGVLGNDGTGITVTKVEGSAANVGATLSTTVTGRNGVAGSFTLLADGSLTYDPPPGFEGTDSFTYSTGDDASETVTVTIDVSDIAWFVDNGAGGSTNIGTFTNPFQSIADFNAANGSTMGPGVDNAISLRTGSGTYTEADGVALLDGQRVVGEAFPFGSEFVADPNSSPGYQAFAGGTNTAPVVEVTTAGNHGIDLASGNTIRGLTIGDVDNTGSFAVGGHAMAGANVGALVVSDVSIAGLGGALDLENCNLNAVFDELSSDGAPRRGIRLVNCTGTLTVLNSASMIRNATGQSIVIRQGSVSIDYPGDVFNETRNFHLIEIVGTTGGDVTFGGRTYVTHPESRSILIEQSATNLTFADIDIGTAVSPVSPVDAPGQAGIHISGNSTGTVTIDDVNVFVTGADHPGIMVDNTSFAGTLIVNQGHFESDGAPAIDVELTDVTFAGVSVNSQNSGSNGVRLSEVSGSVDLAGGSVTGAGADGFTASSLSSTILCLNLTGNTSTPASATDDGFVLTQVASSTFELQDYLGGSVGDWASGKGNTGSVASSGTFTSAVGTCVP